MALHIQNETPCKAFSIRWTHWNRSKPLTHQRCWLRMVHETL